MSLQDTIRILFLTSWWTWDRPTNNPLMIHDYVCHYFNLCEAVIWFGFSVLVLRRWWIHHHTSLEVGYAIAFLLFGISDIVEAWKLTSWLLWWKAANLLALLLIRRKLLRQYYLDQRLF